MRKDRINLLIIAASLCGVAFSLSMTGCQKVNVHNAKTALQAINQSKNFSLKYSGSYYKEHTYYFTDKSIGLVSTEYPELTDIYYYDGKGTFEITSFDNDYVGSEYRTKKSVWNSGLYPTLKGVATSYINALDGSKNNFSITNKEYYIAFAKLMTGDSTDAVYIDSFNVSYSQENKSLTYNLTFKNKAITYIASNFYSTKNPIVEYFKEGGKKAFKAPKELKDMKNAMLSNNYVQSVYQMGETESSTGFFYDYIFNPHYWAWYIRSNNNMTGYISLNCPEEVDGDDPHPALKGIYPFNIIDGKISMTPKDASGTENTSIIEFMDYPSRISLWDNIHKFTEADEDMFTDVELLGKGYYTTDERLVVEFCNNFNMEGAFPGQDPQTLLADISYDEEGNLDMIVFYYYFKYSGVTYNYPIPFYNFGKANISVMDIVYNKYHTIDD